MSAAFEDVKNFILENSSISTSLSPDCLVGRGLQHYVSIRSRAPHKPIYDSIMSNAMECERFCPGAGLEYLNLLIGKKSSSCDRPIDRKDFLEKLSGMNAASRDAIVAVSDMCTRDTKIVLRTHTVDSIKIVSRTGCSFDCSCVVSRPGKRVNVKVACIDGYLERVSELHHFLELLASIKPPLPVSIFSRGLSDEVRQTLTVNNMRGILDVSVCVCPFDIEHANTLVDIAVVSGCDVVSTLKGETLSSLSLESLGEVSKSEEVQGGVVLSPRADQAQRIRMHASHLQTKIEERPDIEDVLVNRLKTLQGHVIEVIVPKNNLTRLTSSQIDEGIRMISSLMKGTYDPVGVAQKIYVRTANFFEESIYVSGLDATMA